jgi:hypothetical protein
MRTVARRAFAVGGAEVLGSCGFTGLRSEVQHATSRTKAEVRQRMFALRYHGRMAKVALIALALAGCNQVYGLDQTRLDDARGPVRCTEEAPSFRGTPVLVVPMSTALRYYSLSRDHTLAVGAGPGAVYEGPGDSAALKGALLMPPPPTSAASPQLTPEGDELFISYQASINRYTRGDGWKQEAVLPITSADHSSPTARVHGERHMLVMPNSNEFREYVETAPDQWVQRGDQYMPKDLGVNTFFEVDISADGLHAVIGSLAEVGYASRARLEDRFTNMRTFNPFFGNPQLFDPHLSEDCGRLYFVILGASAGVYYVATE